MLVPRQQYSRELQIACMRELDSGKSMAEIARQYQLSPKRLETWKAEWRAKGELAFPGKGARLQARLDAGRSAELERKIGQQAMEIDFLKKVLQRFKERPLPRADNGASISTSGSWRQHIYQRVQESERNAARREPTV
jgi:transposase-like protein